MNRFSERIGIVQSPTELLVDHLSVELRNSLWNFIHSLYDNRNWEYWTHVAPRVARFFRKVPADELPRSNIECMRWFKEYFFELEWYQLYDLIEFLAVNHTRMIEIRVSDYNTHRHPLREDKFRDYVNAILERELSGYRFIAGVLAPISSKAEAEQIGAAAELASSKGLSGANAHLKAALELLGKRPNPDYRNSVKESISAVESVAKVISGTSTGGLDHALDALAKSAHIHGALKAGFLKLYGYSSDEDGVRHAILDEPTVGFTEAKYMLVSCSAFVYYLIAKADAAGLLQTRK